MSALLNKDTQAVQQIDFMNHFVDEDTRRKATNDAFIFFRQQDDKGNSMLHRAVCFDNIDLVTYLLEEDSNVDYCNNTKIGTASFLICFL